MTQSEQRRRREKLAETLRERREDLGLSRKELAQRTGLSYPYLSQLETGDREPSMNALGKLAAGLEVEPSDLIVGMTHTRTEPSERTASPMRAAAAPVAAPIAPIAAAAHASRDWIPNPGYAGAVAGSTSDVSDKSRRARTAASVVDEAYALLSTLDPDDRVDAAGMLLARCIRDATAP